MSGRSSASVGAPRSTGAPSSEASVAPPAESARPAPAVVTVYGKPDCHLCEEALVALRALRSELGFQLRERDITREESLHRAYFERIPVVELDGEELCEYVLEEAIVRERLESRA